MESQLEHLNQQSTMKLNKDIGALVGGNGERNLHILSEMKERKSREEISLSRLLARCQEIAGSSSDLSQEWRLPTFLDSCDQMLSSLPKSPDPTAPSPEALLEYRNSLDLLRKLLPPKQEEFRDLREDELPSPPPVPLPQGTTSRDTVSRQIYQRAVEKQQGSMREQLLGPAGAGIVDSTGELSLPQICMKTVAL